MKMRKIPLVAAMAMAAMVISMTGCGGESEAEAPAVEETADAKSYTVGVMQLVEHPALDAATQGFQDKLKELLGESVTFDVQNAQGESTNCTTIATKFVTDDVDLIMANATGAVQAAAAATGDIPVVGTSVTDYKTAGVIEKNDAPGRNVTGVSDLAPVDQQIALLKKVNPEAKKVAIVYCSAEPNSIFQSELAQKYLTEAGIEFKEYTAADSNEIRAVITKAVGECDTVYVPTDNTMASNMGIIKNVTVPAGIPVITGEEGMCAKGGLATLSISYYELGMKAGEMAYDILVNGADPATTPIAFVSDNIVPKYNAEIAETLGVTMPEDFEAIQ
ncbi:ABC transporter substrate-binding protein [Anaerotignum sp. MB30-C6]|uniref:ABC transporter substrate-binding protein n=1 Tax=Anaerotignum sp. MB30-C6 TaxID=3070814 RepID=UPI0027DBE44E|nr:ABC transporter substrate-binding protein [Anaerotignum sp. MB30-C6]WMI81412.1 ABC transporter substrate-binding protein [Anaerotignum sp. MB30-C6]